MNMPLQLQAKSGDMEGSSSSDHADDVPPLLPGTEEPRSLGDMLKAAEAAQKDAELTPATPATPGGAKPRRSKRPSRAQSRRFARERALQALYQLDLSDAQVSSLRQEFLDTQDMSRVDVDYFLLLFNGVAQSPDTLDKVLHDSLDRPVTDLDPIERCVLRIAAFELTQQLDIPARVVINEGIEITKRFGADKGHRYVNGVLDKLAVQLRPDEMRQR